MYFISVKILQSSAAEIEASQVKVTGEEQIRTRASPLSSREQQGLAVSNQRNKSHGAAAIPLHTALPRPRLWMTCIHTVQKAPPEVCDLHLARRGVDGSQSPVGTGILQQFQRDPSHLCASHLRPPPPPPRACFGAAFGSLAC